MSRFRKLSQTIWHCQYHIIVVPKHRFRIVIGEVAQEVEYCIRAFVEQQKGALVELNIQSDHVHLLVLVPTKVSISNFIGTLKGQSNQVWALDTTYIPMARGFVFLVAVVD